ncbi:MAG: FkbM family methyltransferase [Kiritimatiellae bacterium]|nr:FkbM family methyltransferase [Kiritimatiellia bacterium]
MNNKPGLFAKELLARVLACCYRYEGRVLNILELKTSTPHRPASALEWLKNKLKEVGGRRGWVARHFTLEDAASRLSLVLSRAEAYETVWNRFGDDYSRRIFLDILTFRILGPRHVRLPVSTPQYWSMYDRELRRAIHLPSITTATGWHLCQYTINGTSGTVTFYSTPTCPNYFFELGAYEYRKTPVPIRAKEGDVVVDAGACWGETTLYFADAVGDTGRVYAFEVDPDNLTILSRNLALNFTLSQRAEIVERAVSAASGKQLQFTSNGPSTSSVLSGEGTTFDGITVSLDDFVAQKQLKRLDFIKMDIEGAEESALRGAECTIRKWRPSLAIAAYHKAEDILKIPEFLWNLDVGYSVYLDHFTTGYCETVVFARCEGTGNTQV